MHRVSLFLILLAAAPACGFAQTQAINGSIRGHLTDSAGSSIAQASIAIANAETGFSRSLDTNEDGYFVIPNLPLGTYTVTLQKSGFETQRRTNIVLDAGTEAVIDAQLSVGSVSTTVEVTGGTDVLEPSRLNTGRTLEHEEVDNLPLTSRNPYNFVIFQPGVSGHPNPELGIPRTINTNGLLDRINYQMDGMVNTESDRYGLRLFPISDIYVREIQTVSNSFAPEFGGTAGNIFNVITNSGSNKLHGEFYFIGRPPDWSTRALLVAAGKTSPSIDLHDYAVNSSGAIIKDKLFIFGGYEHLLRALPTAITISPTNAAALGIASNLIGSVPSVQHAQFYNFRADWVINSKHQAFVRYNYFRNEFPFNQGAGALNALDAAADFHDRAHVVGLQLLSSFSPTVLNELRGSIPYRNEAHAPDPVGGPGPQITITSIATFGGVTASGDRFAEKIPSISDSVTVIRGSHTVKAGVGFQENNDNQIATNYLGRYTFASIAAYQSALSGVNPYSYSSFATVLGTPGAAYKSYFGNAFAQDSWQVRPNILLMYGLRYDRFQAAAGEANAPFAWTRSFRTPGANFAPRLGVAWNVDQKTVLRVNSGLFYEAPPTNEWFNSLYNDGSSKSFTDTFVPQTPGAPAFPAILHLASGSAAPSSPNITATTPNFKNAYVLNSNVQVRRALTQNDSLTVGFVRTAGRNLGYLRNINLINPISYLADGRPVYSSAINATTRLYPQFNAITLQDIGAISEYDALVTSYSHRFNAGYLVNANYTWSHSISDAPDANSFEQSTPIEDPTNRRRDRGNSLVNRPNAFNLSSVISPVFAFDNKITKHVVNGNQLTVLANISSGDQQTITANSSTPLNGDGSTGSQRPLFIGRSTVRGPKVFQVDMRYTRTVFTLRERILVKVLAEGNNITNHRNYTTLNTSVPTTALGVPTIPTVFAPTGGLEGRIIQLGIRTDW